MATYQLSVATSKLDDANEPYTVWTRCGSVHAGDEKEARKKFDAWLGPFRWGGRFPNAIAVEVPQQPE